MRASLLLLLVTVAAFGCQSEMVAIHGISTDGGGGADGGTSPTVNTWGAHAQALGLHDCPPSNYPPLLVNTTGTELEGTRRPLEGQGLGAQVLFT